MSHQAKALLILGIGVVSLVITFTFDPIPQPPEYHHFADHRMLLGIPHMGDVLSNFPFIFTGLWGLLLLWRYSGDRKRIESTYEVWPLLVGFLGIALVGPGSAYYHWNPINETLVWDRLPIAVGFMGIFCMMLGERIHVRIGQYLLAPLSLLAAFSVGWWYFSELSGQGDLRLYGWVIFFPMVGIPLLLLMFPAKYSNGRYIFDMLGFYVVAKFFEYVDKESYELTGGIISGHTLKHLFAAVATWSLIRYIQNRRVIPDVEKVKTS